MSSTRLPEKVLLPLGDTTVLGQLIRRLSLSRYISGVVVAIPEGKSDDALADACAELGLACFRGSESDVLARFHAQLQRLVVPRVVRWLRSMVVLVAPASGGRLAD